MYGRSLISLVIAHSLGKRGIEVITCDDVDLTACSFSRYVRRSFVHAPIDRNPQRFLDDLETRLRKLRPTDGRPYALIPVFRETAIIASNRERFAGFMSVAVPPEQSIRAVHPKDSLLRTARRLGLPAPSTWDPDGDGEELHHLAAIMRYPVLIKPRDEVGGRGIVKCHSFPEVQVAFARYRQERGESPLIQEYAAGEDYCLTVLYDRGRRIADMAYRNLYRFPVESGAGIVRETVESAPFLETADLLMRDVLWHGIVELDFRWNPAVGTEPLLIEVNPRFWAGLFHSVESGVDFPWLLYQLVVEGHANPSSDALIGQRTKVPGLWLLSAIHDTVASDAGFENLRTAWQEAWSSQNEQTGRDVLRRVSGILDSGVDIRDTYDTIRSILREGRQAKNDVFFRDDPLILLGVFFVLGSLIRHGKLPPEMRNR
jgi:predicted ATP-grasp superfamily ATP-dependent carboligase